MAKPLLTAVSCIFVIACSSSDDADTDQVVNDRYAFAGVNTVVINAAQGVLANDGSDYQSVELLSGVNGNSSLTLNSNGSFSYVPAPGIAKDGFVYNAIAENGTKKQATVNIVIAQGVAGCTQINVNNSQSSTFSVLPDNISGDDGFSFSISEQPGKGSLSNVNIDTGEVTYLFDGGARGNDVIKVRATDSFGRSADLEYQVALTPVRIMPLGDSLTEGIESDSNTTSSNPDLDSPSLPVRVGYRKPLFEQLNSNGYSFDFVGSQIDAGSNILSDFQHQGHPGYTDFEISGQADPDGSNSDEFNAATDGVYKWLSQNPADVILLHAGTNNIIRRTTSVGMERLLDEIERWQTDNNSSITTLVAKIIDKQRNPTDHANVLTYNGNIETVVNNRISQGDDLVLVDMFSAVSPTLLDPVDSTHLTPAGYDAMAQGWLDSIDTHSVVAKCN